VLASFAALALLLVSVGIYGVMSHSVSQRTREIGIRVALGADGRHVFWLIIGQGSAMVLAGVVLGVAATFALARVVGRLLYGVTATDPLTLITVSAVLGLVALLACALPARRTLRLDPTTALRSE
jgi:ABC-type antimicrobial peptide transport system permease subunit